MAHGICHGSDTMALLSFIALFERLEQRGGESGSARRVPRRNRGGVSVGVEYLKFNPTKGERVLESRFGTNRNELGSAWHEAVRW